MTGGPAGPSTQCAHDRPSLPDPVDHATTVRTLSGRGALDRARRNSQRQSRPRGHRAVVRRGFGEGSGKDLATRQAGDVLLGGASGAGSLLLNTKASQEAACFRAPAAIVSGPESESRDAGVSRFGENGSHLAETNAAEGHAGQVDGPGSSGNAEIGSHLAETNAAEGHAGQVDGPGSSGNAEIGSHLAATNAAEGPAGQVGGPGSSGNTGTGSHLEMAPVTNAPESEAEFSAATCRGPCGASGRNACP